MPFQRLFLLALLMPVSGWAQKSFEISVEDFRIREGFTEASPAVSVIEAAEIQKSGATTVGEVINGMPGVFVAQNGGASQPTSVFIRGSESRHTLVLIDGMELNDPLNPSRAFDFSGLTTENIERIEIFRGAQSVKFGSDAIGGVINIITKQGSGPLKGKVSLEAGTYNTLNNASEISGSKEKINYAFGTSLSMSEGFSAADSELGNTEADFFQRVTLSGRAGTNFSQDTNINASVRATEMKTDLDATGGPGGDDPNYTSEARQYIGGVFVKTRGFERKLSAIIGATLAYNTRSDENPPDAAHTSSATDNFTSMATKIEARNEYTISDEHSLQFGLQLRGESGHSESVFNSTPADLADNSNYINGVYFLHRYQFESYFTELGLRQDVRSGGSGITSYSAGGGYRFEQSQTEFRASYATGFKTPSLYQLYSSFGNEALNDEKSSSAEASLEKKISAGLKASVTIFMNRYTDLIEFDPVAMKYFNVSKSSSRGTEIQGEWQFNRNFFAKGTYTNLLAVNDSNGFKLLRRPDNTFAAEAGYNDATWETSFTYSYTGERSDIDPVSLLRIAMPAYDVVNARVGYVYNKLTRFSLRAVNLLNRKYQSVAGFGSSGQAFYAGLSREF